MASDKKLCSCGKCGKGAVKDGLSTKCYRLKHGVLPFPKAGVKARPGQAASSQGKTPREKVHTHDDGECEGCKALQLKIDELNQAEAVMVALGIFPAEKFEQARKMVRELRA